MTPTAAACRKASLDGEPRTVLVDVVRDVEVAVAVGHLHRQRLGQRRPAGGSWYRGDGGWGQIGHNAIVTDHEWVNPLDTDPWRPHDRHNPGRPFRELSRAEDLCQPA